MRGAVYNRATGKFEVVKNSLNDGLAVEDIPISSNTILEGAYPKFWGKILILKTTLIAGNSLESKLPKCNNV